MAKTRPGLPEGFEINLESPSQLGDYLDEGFDEQVARAYVSKQRAATAPQRTPVAERNDPPRPAPVARQPALLQAGPPPSRQSVPAEEGQAPARDDPVLSL